jgi:hypothetical protein
MPAFGRHPRNRPRIGCVIRLVDTLGTMKNIRHAHNDGNSRGGQDGNSGRSNRDEKRGDDRCNGCDDSCLQLAQPWPQETNEGSCCDGIESQPAYVPEEVSHQSSEKGSEVPPDVHGEPSGPKTDTLSVGSRLIEGDRCRLINGELGSGNTGEPMPANDRSYP